eukprot:jgi/Psemu1/5506/gm1.5506_g
MSAVAQLQAAKQAPFFFKPKVRYEDYPTVRLVHSVTRYISSTPAAASTASTPSTPGATLPPPPPPPPTTASSVKKQDTTFCPDSSDSERLIRVLVDFIDAVGPHNLNIKNDAKHYKLCEVLGGDLKHTWDKIVNNAGLPIQDADFTNNLNAFISLFLPDDTKNTTRRWPTTPKQPYAAGHNGTQQHCATSTTARINSNTRASTRRLMNYLEFFQGDNPFGNVPKRRNESYQAIYSLFSGLEGELLLAQQVLDLFETQAIRGQGLFIEDSAGVPSTNQGNAFGYIGDLDGDACELLVQVNAAMLAKAAANWVFLIEHHMATLAQNVHHQYVPAIPEGVTHTEMLQVHKVFFLPFEFICKPLLDTLRSAGTCTTTGANRAAGLTMYMKRRVLLRDLPNLGLTAPLGNAPLMATATTLTDSQLRLSKDLDCKRTEAVKQHTVTEVWGPSYTKQLLLLCGKKNEDKLPPIYPAWAKKSKHENTHMIFQSQVSSRAKELGVQPPLVTTTVLKRFQVYNFHGTDLFDVADGILPLAFTPLVGSAATLKQEQCAATNVAVYNTMISTECNSLNREDSPELQKTKAYYLAVLATLLGAAHAVVEDEMGELITTAIVVYYFQIRMRGWLEEQWESDLTIPPLTLGMTYKDTCTICFHLDALLSLDLDLQGNTRDGTFTTHTGFLTKILLHSLAGTHLLETSSPHKADVTTRRKTFYSEVLMWTNNYANEANTKSICYHWDKLNALYVPDIDKKMYFCHWSEIKANLKPNCRCNHELKLGGLQRLPGKPIANSRAQALAMLVLSTVFILKWAIELSHSWELCLQTYYGKPDQIDSAISRSNIWFKYHAPINHAKALTIATSFDFYEELCDGTQTRAEQMSKYDPKNAVEARPCGEDFQDDDGHYPCLLGRESRGNPAESVSHPESIQKNHRFSHH